MRSSPGRDGRGSSRGWPGGRPMPPGGGRRRLTPRPAAASPLPRPAGCSPPPGSRPGCSSTRSPTTGGPSCRWRPSPPAAPPSSSGRAPSSCSGVASATRALRWTVPFGTAASLKSHHPSSSGDRRPTRRRAVPGFPDTSSPLRPRLSGCSRDAARPEPCASERWPIGPSPRGANWAPSLYWSCFLPVTFTDLGVSADISSRLAEQGVTEPFPIQAATIPAALDGRDICGHAPTGSGKTLAFGIPLVSRVGRARPGRPKALVLAPTRELAAQIERTLSPLAATRQRRVAAVYGGVGFGDQLAALRRGADIVVATPGRLADLIERKRADLGEVEIVVVDEADRMADMGFLHEVRRLLDRVRSDRQTFLFSATLDGDVDVLIRRYQRDPFVHGGETPAGGEDRRQHLFWKTDRAERAAMAA